MPAVQVFGPLDGYAFVEDGVLQVRGTSTSIEAETFGEALAAFTALTGTIVTPYDGPEVADDPRYFSLDAQTNEAMPGGLVDIHVLRDGEEICPGHDLAFALQEGDILSIGLLVC